MKTPINSQITSLQNQPDEGLVYQSPEIIYEGFITVRAGSPFDAPDDGTDPAGIFGTN